MLKTFLSTMIIASTSFATLSENELDSTDHRSNEQAVTAPTNTQEVSTTPNVSATLSQEIEPIDQLLRKLIREEEIQSCYEKDLKNLSNAYKKEVIAMYEEMKKNNNIDYYILLGEVSKRTFLHTC